MKKYIVIYDNGNETRSALRASDTPDSSASHAWGLAETATITAVVGPVNPDDITVWIDEEEQTLVENIGDDSGNSDVDYRADEEQE